jgi:signal transduction histidine kinase
MNWESAAAAAVAAASQKLGARPETLSAYITLALSCLVALGYATLAFNWYFQIKVAPPQARAALRRLLLISLACALCGGTFYLTDLAWGHFRLYDLGIAMLAAYTWAFVLRMRGALASLAFLISATPHEHRRAVKWLGACADIEDQKRLAAEMERQARQKSFFLNALSHDLRSPLNVLALHAELLRTSIKDADVVESARMIVENATAAGELINRLLDFARVGSLERNVTEQVSLPAVLQQVQRRFQPVAERSGLFLRLSLECDLQIRTDRHKVERIVGNLIDNAIKYTPRGGVTIALVKAADDGAAAIEIRDTGIGVPRDKADSLFDEFYQVGNDERDRRKGFGLGLAICRALARQIGGDVQLVSTGHEGSCFALTLPVRADHPDSTSATAAADLPAATPIPSELAAL